MVTVNVTLNAWSKLAFHDPEKILIKLRIVEVDVAQHIVDKGVRTLRTNSLKEEREARDAALFSYGMGKALGTKVLMAREQSSDYDFVTCWRTDDALNYCPVQLKELPPSDLNPDLSLRSLLAGLSKYSTSHDTVLAVKVNREGRFQVTQLFHDDVPFSQVWFFGATNPDQNDWFLYGDALAEPNSFTYRYPG